MTTITVPVDDCERCRGNSEKCPAASGGNVVRCPYASDPERIKRSAGGSSVRRATA